MQYRAADWLLQEIEIYNSPSGVDDEDDGL